MALIYVVEDDKNIQEIETFALANVGYEVKGFDSAMDFYEALKSITINPAEILGISDSVGSIETGKDADMVLFNDDPLTVKSKPLMVIAGGNIIG